jgi:TonB-dependent receptor
MELQSIQRRALRPTRCAAAVTLAVAAFGPGAAGAQQAAGETAQGTQEAPHIVVVSGTRQSVASAIDRKKGAGTVTDSIVAEDIGQFPDKNVGEALSRITGVQIQSDFGEGNQVSIRGVAPELNRIEINGMSVLSTSESPSGGRAPELRELPSELIKSIDVYKGVTADLTEGGLGGTVSVKTNKPLDFKKFTLATTASAERNSMRGGTQPRGSLLVADRFLDNRLGVMANIVYDKVLTRGDRVRNTGWNLLRDWDFSSEKTVTSLDPAIGAIGDKAGCAALPSGDRTECNRQWFDYSPTNPRHSILTRDHERKSAELTAQYQLSKQLSAYISTTRSQQDSRLVDRTVIQAFNANVLASPNRLPTYNAGVPSGGSCTAAPANATPPGMVVTGHRVSEYVVGNCLAVSGSGGANALRTELRDFGQKTEQRYNSAGFNYRKGSLDVEGQVVRSRAEYQNDTNFVGVTMNAPGLKVSLDGQGFPRFTFPSAAVDPSNPAAYTQVSFNYTPVEQETFEDQVKLDVRYRTGLPFLNRISAGFQGRKNGTLRFTEGGGVLDPGSDLRSTADDLSLLTSQVQQSLIYDPLNATGVLRGPVQQPYTTSTYRQSYVTGAQMQQMVGTILGQGPNFQPGDLSGFPANWLSPNLGATAPYFDSTYLNHDRVRQAMGSDGKLYAQAPVYNVQERIRAAYLRLDFDHEVHGYTIDGNVGIRYAGTRTKAAGRQRLQERVETSPGSSTGTNYPISDGIAVRETKYNDWLPSFNAASWIIPDELVVRVGLAKVMARPNLEHLNPKFDCIINGGAEQFGGDGYDNCSAGNPDLKPYRATNKDVSVEWYPNRDSQLSLAYFRKDIKTGIITGVVERKDLFGDGRLFDVTAPRNYEGASTDGIELAGRTALTFLPGFLGGFGLDANYTRMSYDYAPGAELVNPIDGTELPFPGLSKNSYNVGVWYDRGPINARLAYNARDSYYSGGISGTTPVYFEKTGFLDAKIQYRLTPNFTLSAEAKNLTDEHTLSTAGTAALPIDYTWSGRRYYVSLSYKF